MAGEAAWEKLDAAINSDDHGKALKLANSILAAAPNEATARRIKVVALVQLNEFDEALAAIPSGSDDYAFEKAYCLYRSGKLQAALQAAAAMPPEQEPARLQLEAQLQYRLGSSKECIQLYDRLFQQHKEDSLDLKTNVLAAYVAAGLASEVPDLMSAMKITPKSSFEVGYNKACAAVERRDWAAAESELRAALKLGRETLLLEDASEEEAEEELAGLRLQLAYVLSRTGRGQEAMQTYLELSKNENLDEVTRAVATNNHIAGSNRLDASAANKKFVAGSLKKLEGMLDGGSALRFNTALDSRLSPSQKLGIQLNRGLLCLVGQQVDAAAEVAAALAQQHPGSLAVALLAAAVKAKQGKYGEADKGLAAFAASQPEAAVEATLTRAQLALERQDVAAALKLLTAVPEPSVRYSAGLVATATGLCEQQGDLAVAEVLLDGALGYWQAQGGGGGGRKAAAAGGADAAAAKEAAMTWCLQQLVSLKLRLGKVAEAAGCFQKLQASGASSAAGVEVLVKLARATAATDAAAAAALESALPRLPDTSALDLDALEDSAARSASAPALAAAAEASRKRAAAAMEVDAAGPSGAAGAPAAAASAAKPKKSNKRKRRLLPQGYDASKPDGGLPPPDPERWLPKWQRAEYKKKRRNRGKDAVKGSQGAGKVDEALDRTKASTEGAKSAKPSLPAKKGKK